MILDTKSLRSKEAEVDLFYYFIQTIIGITCVDIIIQLYNNKDVHNQLSELSSLSLSFLLVLFGPGLLPTPLFLFPLRDDPVSFSFSSSGTEKCYNQISFKASKRCFRVKLELMGF